MVSEFSIMSETRRPRDSYLSGSHVRLCGGTAAVVKPKAELRSGCTESRPPSYLSLGVSYGIIRPYGPTLVLIAI
ncbi:unnamed protein product [Phytomonas sp. EM1]|nr:unnamed protein product [Phytomonas sp. EM1]CCW65247.1 unnamed protein product [Phytomonas sp. EM1]|eukprot:CCW65240.1 unnamed protein product [Phytomonas sp. isolate EM1]